MIKAFKLTLLLLIFLVLTLFFSSSTNQIQTARAEDTVPVYLPYISREPSCANKIPFQPVSDAGNEAETLNQINAQRAANGGLAALTMNNALVQIARFHSNDMATNNVTTHEGSAGETPWSRYDWLCELFGAKGEIIGWGFGGDVSQMINWWMNSQGHHDIILTASFTTVGVGYTYQPGSAWKHYWTVDFGSTPIPASIRLLSITPVKCQTETESSPEGGVSVTICQ